MSLPKVLRFGFVSVPGKDRTTGKTIRVPRDKDLAFADILSQALGVEYELVLSMDGAYGEKLENGTFTGPLGLLQKGEVDVVISTLTMSEERLEVANISFPYFIDAYTFTTRKPDFSPKFLTVAYPFSLNLWISVLVCFLAMCLVFCVVLWGRRGSQRVVLKTFGSLLNQGSVFESERASERILLLFWALGTLFLAYSYTAVLLSFLTLPIRERGVRTIQELSQAVSQGSGFQAATFRGIFLPALLMDSEDESLRIIGMDLHKNQVEVSQTKDFLLQSDGKVALITPRYYVAFLRNRCFTSRDNLFTYLVGIPYAKSFCCPHRIHDAVLRILAGGFYDKLNADYVFQTFLNKLSPGERSEPEPELKLGLTDMSGAFGFLLIGYVLSLGVFLGEVLPKKRSRQVIKKFEHPL